MSRFKEAPTPRTPGPGRPAHADLSLRSTRRRERRSTVRRTALRSAALAGLLAVPVLLAGCAGRAPADDGTAAGATPAPIAATPEPPTAEAPASLRVPAAAPALLDDGDPASLRTAVGRSLAYLRALPPDSQLRFGPRSVTAAAMVHGLDALHRYLAGDPSPEALAAWVAARFDVLESVGGEDGTVLYTGYYEPVIPGARERTARATVPVYGRPHDLVRVPLRAFDPALPDRRLTGRVTGDGEVVPYYTRAEIREEGALEGRGLEIAWVEDRVDLFFVEVQGSGAIRFPDGGELGIGVAASNGRPYRSIGRLLIDDGLVPAEEMSMQAIRRYLRDHPEEVTRVLDHNASFIFFRGRDTPPIGSLGQPVTPVRSIATDARVFPRGALAFIATTRPAVDADDRVVDGAPLRRFVLNQDTGGAIRGPGRADVFWGRGPEAAETAGRMQQTGRLFFLVPKAERVESRAGAGVEDRSDDGSRDGFRVVVLSDLNSAYGSTTYEPEVATAVDRIVREWRPALVLVAGDLVAGQKRELDDARVRAMWAAFDSVVAAPLRAAGIPLAFTLGNHDASGHPGYERDRRLAEAYARAHPLAGSPALRMVDGDRYPFRYAFTLGDVFFLVLDASTGGVVADTAQMAWIRRTLASDAARSAGMRVSLGHVPLYAVAEGRERPGEWQAEPAALRSALEAGGVRLHVSGHHHAWFPGRAGGLDLLFAGALGQGPRPLLGRSDAAAPGQTVTVLDLFPGRDSIVERTFGVADDTVTPLDPDALPAVIRGPAGVVTRRPLELGPAGPAADDASPVTVVSYNIHAGRDAAGVPNLEAVAELLASVDADIVLLQEVDRGTARSEGADQLAALRELTGMHGAFGKSLDYDGGEYGIALLSRWPLAASRVIPLRAEPAEERAGGAYEPRVALHAVVETPTGPLHVVNTHLGAGSGTYRRQEVTALLAALHRAVGPAGRLVVGGDFNARPDTDEVAAMTLHLRDAWALCGTGDEGGAADAGAGAGATFPAAAPDRRIDYVFLRALGCSAARVPATEASDHRPLVVELR